MTETALRQDGAPLPHIEEKGAFFEVEVLEVQHYTETLFSFRTARPQSFRFRAGEFVMIGLEGEKKPVLRAYSIASPTWDEALEFYSIKVPDGALTSRLRNIAPGDRILLGKKPTGTLVSEALRPGRRLYLFSTGTGAAPFASLIREPDIYERFDEVILTHTCRTLAELAYTEQLVETVRQDPLVGEFANGKLVYFNSVTREEGPRMGRITDLIDTGKLFEMLEREPLDPSRDRAMVCGSFEMLNDLKHLLEARGFEEGSNARPGDFVVEKAFSGEGI
ncbi:ferredoxin--NADP reductase [Marinicauda sp. Alg238-R41]|uniref:ferredoxin--NADP reductase n=1 Tax=Marinicauda sp. Alg238-R41 TaxID=2993447 RepID=UPI0022E40181|nr:ferredoxin--NADP reductase [Marinicauda sp. Alg238-R41]